MKNELELFENYIKNFDLNLEPIRHKYEHTFRVMNYAEEIAKSINLSEEDIITCKICALFHDIGRFPQYMEYHSYDDYVTCDHGDKGEEVLKELGYKDELILKVVKLHNKAYLPDNLTEREFLFSSILRDADKVDIMIRQALVNKDETYYIDEYNKEKLLSNKLLEKIDRNNNSLIIYKIIAFIYDINYKKTFEIIKDEDIINKKMNLIIDRFPNEETLSLKEHFNNYLEGKLLS